VHPTLTPLPAPAVLLAVPGAGSPVRLPAGVGVLAPAVPLALSGPAPSSVVYARSSNPVTPRSGRTFPAGGRSGLWLRNAAAGLCVLAAAAAAVSFTASGDVGYRNCLNALQVWVGRVSAVGCGGLVLRRLMSAA
jgi:hypothetical protein